MLVVGTRVIPWVLARVDRLHSRELLLLAGLAIALGIAFGAAEIFGVSFALGAFFAGVVLNGSAIGHRVAGQLLPFRDAFAVLFFVAVGMAFEPAIVVDRPVALAATIAIIVVGKSLVAFLIVLALGRPASTGLRVAAALAQIGEFSFILAAMAVALGVLPAEGKSLMLGGALASILLNPLVFRLARRLAPPPGAAGAPAQLIARASNADLPAAAAGSRAEPDRSPAATTWPSNASRAASRAWRSPRCSREPPPASPARRSATRWCARNRRAVDLLAWAHEGPSWGWMVSVLLGASCMAAARWLIRFAPEASGSGVQHVEAVAAGEAEPASPAVIPVKFVGGVLAIGSGMVLGREGPTVQMGATLGVIVARWLRMRLEDIRDLQTACGGAGLGVAFNAPMGGALFVFEEVDRRFGMRLTLATLLAAGTAISVSRYLLGAHVELPIAALPNAQLHELIPYVLLGVLLGFAGLAYNRSVIFALDLHARLSPHWTPEAKAASGRRRGRPGGVVRAAAGRRRRSAQPRRAARRGAAGDAADAVRPALAAGRALLRAGRARRAVRAAAAGRRHRRRLLRDPRQPPAADARPASGVVRGGRDGRVLHRRRARAADRASCWSSR